MTNPERDNPGTSLPKQEKARPSPPEGPHAREDLTDREKTPGTGSLPDKGDAQSDVGPD